MGHVTLEKPSLENTIKLKEVITFSEGKVAAAAALIGFLSAFWDMYCISSDNLWPQLDRISILLVDDDKLKWKVEEHQKEGPM